MCRQGTRLIFPVKFQESSPMRRYLLEGLAARKSSRQFLGRESNLVALYAEVAVCCAGLYVERLSQAMSHNLELRSGPLGLHCLRKSMCGWSVIFAHGILSDGVGAWGRPSWPQLLVDDEDLKNYGIYVFSYRTSMASGTYSIGDATRTLKAYFDLEDLWLPDRMVFVGHSMGGIVVRKFITTNQTRLISERIDVGLFLIASPSLGARAATTLTALSWIFGHTQALVASLKLTPG
jgi:pimeloyl-ACP methyl ester carboxylesterase